MQKNTISKLGLAAVVLAVGLAVGVGIALAHAGIQSTSPKNGAKLDQAPAKVAVTFEEEVRSGTITVKAADGTVVSRGKGGRNPENVRQIRVALRTGLGSGAYKVRWSVVAADGDTQRGTFRFTVR